MCRALTAYAFVRLLAQCQEDRLVFIASQHLFQSVDIVL